MREKRGSTGEGRVIEVKEKKREKGDKERTVRREETAKGRGIK